MNDPQADLRAYRLVLNEAYVAYIYLDSRRIPTESMDYLADDCNRPAETVNGDHLLERLSSNFQSSIDHRIASSSGRLIFLLDYRTSDWLWFYSLRPRWVSYISPVVRKFHSDFKVPGERSFA